MSALGADSYRTTATAGNDWDLEAITGDLYWTGDEAIPEDTDSYNIIVEAVNRIHATLSSTVSETLDEGVTQTVVVINIED